MIGPREPGSWFKQSILMSISSHLLQYNPPWAKPSYPQACNVQYASQTRFESPSQYIDTLLGIIASLWLFAGRSKHVGNLWYTWWQMEVCWQDLCVSSFCLPSAIRRWWRSICREQASDHREPFRERGVHVNKPSTFWFRNQRSCEITQWSRREKYCKPHLINFG